ncbi:hypothetical protein AGMMS50249_2040 [candidate division SR1 bacterium]|nr:hypothetical protein AGMMS50249_2040 [candidate division SR1 bacterium]
MTRRKQVSKWKITGITLGMLVFVLLITNADKLNVSSGMDYVNPTFIGEGGPEAIIKVDEVATTIEETEDGAILWHIVQPGENLESIATEFGISVSNLKKINKISGVSAGDRILVTSEEDGIIYTLKDAQNVKVFANKYGLNLEDLMTLNYILDDSEILQAGQEIFINISTETANNIPGFIDKAQPNLNPQPVKPKVVNKPTTTTTKPSTTTTTKPSTTNTTTTNTSTTETVTNVASSTLSKWTYTKNITNGFARGYCTWYVATQMPSLFPYTSDTTQSRSFGGNANQRYANAQKAGISVGSSPKAGSIIVYQQLRSSAGHVGIVRSVNRDAGTMVVEDMNYDGKFVVTKRTENINRSGVVGYIYG